MISAISKHYCDNLLNMGKWVKMNSPDPKPRLDACTNALSSWGRDPQKEMNISSSSRDYRTAWSLASCNTLQIVLKLQSFV